MTDFSTVDAQCVFNSLTIQKLDVAHALRAAAAAAAACGTGTREQHA
jgi:hypothetical protein